jgi:hypothetical protein
MGCATIDRGEVRSQSKQFRLATQGAPDMSVPHQRGSSDACRYDDGK